MPRNARALACLVAAGALSVAAPAAAQSSPPPEGSEGTQTWYGYQTLVTDVVADVLVVGFGVTGGSSAGSNTLLGAAAAVHSLGAPSVHLFHRQYGRAALSFGLRVTLPCLGALVGAGIGASQSQTSDDEVAFSPPLILGALGFAVGWLASSAIDDSAIAWEHAAPPPAGVRSPPPVEVEGIQWAPTLSPLIDRSGARGASLGLVGTFGA